MLTTATQTTIAEALAAREDVIRREYWKTLASLVPDCAKTVLASEAGRHAIRRERWQPSQPGKGAGPTLKKATHTAAGETVNANADVIVQTLLRFRGENVLEPSVETIVNDLYALALQALLRELVSDAKRTAAEDAWEKRRLTNGRRIRNLHKKIDDHKRMIGAIQGETDRLEQHIHDTETGLRLLAQTDAAIPDHVKVPKVTIDVAEDTETDDETTEPKEADDGRDQD